MLEEMPKDLDVIAIARRVQRMELLLFQTPDVDLANIDRHMVVAWNTDYQVDKPLADDSQSAPGVQSCPKFVISLICLRGKPL